MYLALRGYSAFGHNALVIWIWRTYVIIMWSILCLWTILIKVSCWTEAHSQCYMLWGPLPLVRKIIHTWNHYTQQVHACTYKKHKDSIHVLSAYMYVFQFNRHRINCPTASEESFVSLDILKEQSKTVGTISEFYFWITVFYVYQRQVIQYCAPTVYTRYIISIHVHVQVNLTPSRSWPQGEHFFPVIHNYVPSVLYCTTLRCWLYFRIFPTLPF